MLPTSSAVFQQAAKSLNPLALPSYLQETRTARKTTVAAMLATMPLSDFLAGRRKIIPNPLMKVWSLLENSLMKVWSYLENSLMKVWSLLENSLMKV